MCRRGVQSQWERAHSPHKSSYYRNSPLPLLRSFCLESNSPFLPPLPIGISSAFIPFSFKEGSMASRILVLKDVPILIPRTCDYVTLHGKRDCADVIKLKTLREGDYLRLAGGYKIITRVLTRDWRSQESQRKVWRHADAAFGGGGRANKLRSTGGL